MTDNFCAKKEKLRLEVFVKKTFFENFFDVHLKEISNKQHFKVTILKI